MGAWGTAIYSDDLAADLRDELRDLVAEGMSSAAAVDKLVTEYADLALIRFGGHLRKRKTSEER